HRGGQPREGGGDPRVRARATAHVPGLGDRRPRARGGGKDHPGRRRARPLPREGSRGLTPVAGQPPAPSAPWTAPPPAAPSWVPRPPKPRRRRVWIYLLVGAVVVILGLTVASGTIWIHKVKPPIDAANDYLRDIRRGDYRAAFAQLCAQEQLDGSPRSLQNTVDRLAIFGIYDYQVSRVDVGIDGEVALVRAELSADACQS